MADTPLPAPKNSLVELVNIILDNLIKGIGVSVVVGEATLYAPWLGLPVIRYLFKGLVDFLAGYVDTFAVRNVDIILIRFQNDDRKVDYDDAIARINRPGATPDDIQEARDALRRLVNRNR